VLLLSIDFESFTERLENVKDNETAAMANKIRAAIFLFFMAYLFKVTVFEFFE
jgi:hypothetical protein